MPRQIQSTKRPEQLVPPWAAPKYSGRLRSRASKAPLLARAIDRRVLARVLAFSIASSRVARVARVEARAGPIPAIVGSPSSPAPGGASRSARRPTVSFSPVRARDAISRAARADGGDGVARRFARRVVDGGRESRARVVGGVAAGDARGGCADGGGDAPAVDGRERRARARVRRVGGVERRRTRARRRDARAEPARGADADVDGEGRGRARRCSTSSAGTSATRAGIRRKRTKEDGMGEYEEIPRGASVAKLDEANDKRALARSSPRAAPAAFWCASWGRTG